MPEMAVRDESGSSADLDAKRRASTARLGSALAAAVVADARMRQRFMVGGGVKKVGRMIARTIS